nr:MAG TPA: hypothetical protein [Caudoviricetes sp.]
MSAETSLLNYLRKVQNKHLLSCTSLKTSES